MTKICDLPRLEIVSIDSLILHEYHDGQRTPPLIDKLKTSGILKNPPIVISFRDQADKFVVLDGANRFSAFKRSDIPHIVAQIVEANDPGLVLSTWNHVLWGLGPEELLDCFHKVPGMALEKVRMGQHLEDFKDIRNIAALCLPDGRVFNVVSAVSGLADRVEALNAVVDCYIDMAQIDRTTTMAIDPLVELYPDLSGLVLLPTYRVEDIIELAAGGHLMPPGATRFTISPRVLHINYPLVELMNSKNTAQKNEALQKWLQDCCSIKGYRYYEESTILFDE